MPDFEAQVEMSAEAKLELSRTKATCPFIGSAVVEGILPVRNDAENPLASIDDVRRLGNQHPGDDLGELLALFATGNHALMRNSDGHLLSSVPTGLFSLDFPPSQGSHPGDSGILQRDLQHPRFSEDDFNRLASRASSGRLTRQAVGDFIAENVHRDPNARTLGREEVERMGLELSAFVGAEIHAAGEKLLGRAQEASATQRLATEKFTNLLADDNIVGSSGEFGLLFTLLSGRPDAIDDEGEPVLLLDDVRMMFQEKHLPAGWNQGRKTRSDWARHTFAIASSAYGSFHQLTSKAGAESPET